MFLERTIGYLENEQESFLTVHYILFGSLVYMILGSLLEGWLFYLYNEKFHPFKKILDPDDGIELKDMSELQSLLNNPGNSSQQTKDCPIKKETNLEAYISVNFLHILTNSAPQIMQIFPAFHRDAL